ncbi:YlbD family protein [Falsibacillus pallidus]|uniref:Putative coat protein YlbD-like n=1 Tax=Falsibacillus pallidus TaxID=493781 RepID=A0A370GV75_9BACI|nr:YlbD family protein [Falsibacillus pallidus]RDI47582.1 putative coat protein YlbD-like [Falsibacillus pallidus]
MTSKKLHPSVEKFKEFAQKHPKMVKEVRSGKASWQELYEDWYLLGEEDPRFDPYREEPLKKEAQDKGDMKWMNQIGGMLKNMDANQMQQHINQLSQAIGSIQGVLAQFQGGNSTRGSAASSSADSKPKNPFSFRKD